VSAEKLPGLDALDKSGHPTLSGLACPAAGDCAIGGGYQDSHGNTQVFVDSQVHGKWHKAEEVPGIAALNTRGDAVISGVSCGAAGYCSVAGIYLAGYKTGVGQGFVANEVGGVWHAAQRINGLPAGTGTGLFTASCPSAGNCTIGGSYGPINSSVGFIARETDGTWGAAQPVPGLTTLGAGRHSSVWEISCASAANCSAVGTYKTPTATQVFVATETGGVWHRAVELPGIAALNKGGVAAVSCASPGDCGLVGYLGNSQSPLFVDSQVDGRWQNAQLVSGIPHNIGEEAGALSCPANGDCTADGTYVAADGENHPVLVLETDGTWHAAQQFPGITGLSSRGDAQMNGLSCSSVGNCTAGGGVFTDPMPPYQVSAAFTVTETSGTWHAARKVPGLPALYNKLDAHVDNLSCPPVGNCVSAGVYTKIGSSPGQQLFVFG
jgi:hypothetical protein